MQVLLHVPDKSIYLYPYNIPLEKMSRVVMLNLTAPVLNKFSCNKPVVNRL
jgi:hypothetical protein